MRPPIPVPDRDAGQSQRDLRAFIVRVLLVLGLVVGVLFLWYVREAFLLAFASVIVAVLLAAAAHPIERRTGLRRTWALVIVCAAIILVLVLLGWLVGGQVGSQFSELSETVSGALQSLRERFNISSLPGGEGNGGTAGSQSGGGGESLWSRGFSMFDSLVGQIYSFGSMLLSFLAGFVLVLAGGVFFAADPDVYRRGTVKLFPKDQHDRVRRTLTISGRALKLWLLAQLISMAIVGALTGLGTWAIGLPAPVALGLFAAVTEFVPIIGPIIGAVPGLLLAASQGSTTLLWAAALYLAIQQLESNVIMPIVERRMVEIPPGLFLFAALALGLIFGAVGVLIAAPLTVVCYAAVKALYIRDTLGEETSIPGEKGG